MIIAAAWPRISPILGFDLFYALVIVSKPRLDQCHSSSDSRMDCAADNRNGFAERLIGSIRRECLDHFVLLGEAHLRRILRNYRRYYNQVRTHRSLDKDAPMHRPIQHTGNIASRPILGGLHHHYVRI
jgi:hypothetical protein